MYLQFDCLLMRNIHTTSNALLKYNIPVSFTSIQVTCIFLADVYFSYPLRSDVEILNGLDLTIECGKVTALVGPSGAGKSTVVQLLARYYEVLLLIYSDTDSFSLLDQCASLFHFCSQLKVASPWQGKISVYLTKGNGLELYLWLIRYTIKKFYIMYSHYISKKL